MTSPLLQAASAAAGAQQYPAGALYLVATPIGNLADITLRALHLLAIADAVACEDTRNSGHLLRHYGIEGKPLVAVHEHNEAQATPQVLQRLARGERVAYVSDAGTPAVSDPGARLVAAAAQAGHRVVPLPGASSVVAALSAAGDAQAQGFRFAGFLPAKGAARQQAIEALAGETASVVLFEAPHRIAGLLAALAAAVPGRQLTICRELTKQFETVHTLAAEQAPPWLAADANRERGEFVLVLHAPAAAESAGADELSAADQRLLQLLLEALPLKQAVALAARIGGAPRNRLYDTALALRGPAPTEDEAGEPG